MEMLTCPFCRTADQHFLFATDQYNLRQCDSCGMVYKSDSRETSDASINKELYTDAFIERRNWAGQRLFSVARRRLHLLQRHLAPGDSILEIGPGTGEFARLARAEGFQIEAIELSEPLCKYIGKSVGIPCFNGKLEDFDPELKDFHAIVAFDLVEHLADPLTFLHHAVRRLCPHGIIFLEMPNWQSLERQVFGHLWNMINIRDHLAFLSEETCCTLAKKLSLKVVSVRSYETYWELPFATLFCMLNFMRIRKFHRPKNFSIGKLPPSDSCPPVAEEDSFPNTYLVQELPAAFAMLTAGFTFPLRCALGRLGLGTELSIIARI